MASGDTLDVISVLANEPPTASFATPDLRNLDPTLDFDGTADEEAVFTGVMPRNYGAATGITVITWWSFTSATSGSFRVQVALERMDAALDIDAGSFAAFQSAGGTVPGTSGFPVAVSVAITAGSQMDSVVAGDLYRLKIRRDADGTSWTDDTTTDGELLGIEVKET